MITKETRRMSYDNILKNLGTRQSQVFTELLCFPQGITASELANEMHKIGFFRTPDRNNVHPRLNEMVEMNIVEVIGKRQCAITNKTVAVYKVKDDVLRIVMEELN
ncbi:MAG TPA: hypothetical protein VKU94_01935 [Geobacterales bacterium]|nr:hypothetical protein [Geobacterales bacterium]